MYPAMCPEYNKSPQLVSVFIDVKISEADFGRFFSTIRGSMQCSAGPGKLVDRYAIDLKMCTVA